MQQNQNSSITFSSCFKQSVIFQNHWIGNLLPKKNAKPLAYLLIHQHWYYMVKWEMERVQWEMQLRNTLSKMSLEVNSQQKWVLVHKYPKRLSQHPSKWSKLVIWWTSWIQLGSTILKRPEVTNKYLKQLSIQFKQILRFRGMALQV